MTLPEPVLSAAVERQWRRVEPDARRIAGDLWAEPEIGLLERESAARLGTWLAEQGLEVAPSVGGLPTAFVGQSGTGSPTVGRGACPRASVSRARGSDREGEVSD